MLFYKDKVIAWYQEAIAIKPIDAELKAALRTQERIPLFVTNLATELQKVQDLRLKKGKPLFGERTLKETVYDFVDVFIKGLVSAKNAEYEASINKIVRAQKAQELKDMESTLDGKPQGAFEEIEMEFVYDRAEEEEERKTT